MQTQHRRQRYFGFDAIRGMHRRVRMIPALVILAPETSLI